MDVDDAGVAPGRPRYAPGLIATAAWLGLVVGLLEVGLVLVEQRRNMVATIGALRLNRHYPWMIPTAHLLVFGACGLALELIRRARPGLAARIAAPVLVGLALLSLLLTIPMLHGAACLLLAGGLATRLIYRGRRSWPSISAMIRVSLPPLGLALVALIAGRHAQLAWAEQRAATKPPAKGSPNVLFIVMDTVRARSLSLHGYARPTSPRLEKLARSGVKFEEARSSAPWTLPSHATMFTGRWPGELFRHHEQSLDGSVPTIAGYLGGQGYATAGFVANTFYCNTGYGLSSGFDHYEDFFEAFDTSPTEILRNTALGRRVFAAVDDHGESRPDGRKDADQINADFLAWLPTSRGRPFFAFLNYYDAHAPYFPPARAGRHFGLRPETPADLAAMVAWHRLEYLPADPRETRMAIDGYDDCIAYLDGALGRLFDEMDRKGLMENTLVVVTSDHGEEIGEHRLVGHGRSLYRDELHVPLLIVKPGRVPSGKVVAEPVSLRDLPATLVDLLGLSGPSPFPGRSLAPLWADPTGPGRPEPREVRSEVAVRERSSKTANRAPAIRGPMVSVLADGMTYIRNADGTEEIYRLADDPTESHNLAATESARPALARLRDLADRKSEVASAPGKGRVAR